MIKQFFRTTALVAPIFVVGGFGPLATAQAAECDDIEVLASDTRGDCIIITQIADTKGTTSNSATVELGGQGTAILPIGEYAQSGDNNDAIFDITGNYNTIYFAQVGNSQVTMVVDGDSNTVTLNEFGGDTNRTAVLNGSEERDDFSVTGEGNDLEISAQVLASIYNDLHINLGDSLADANYIVMQVTYDDFSSIVADIIGDGANITIDQENGDGTDEVADATIAPSITFSLNSLNAANINRVNLEQYGFRNNIALTISGEGNDIEVVQDSDDTTDSERNLNAEISGNNNEITVSQSALQDDDAVTTDLDVVGNANIIEIYDAQQLYGSALIVSGSDNEVNLRTAGGDDAQLDISTNITGSGNVVDLVDDAGDQFDISGVVVRSINLRINDGDDNTIQQTGSLNLGDTDGAYIEFDVWGSSNILSFGAVGSIGIDATITGDGNTFTVNDTDNLTASITGDDNSLSIERTDNTLQSSFLVAGNGNEISLSDLDTHELDVSITESSNSNTITLTDLGADVVDLSIRGSSEGNTIDLDDLDLNDLVIGISDSSDDNNITLSDLGLNNLDIAIEGSSDDNSITLSDLDSNDLDIAIEGSDNSTSISGVEELTLDLAITGNGNSYTQEMGNLYDPNFAFSVDATLTGDLNSINVDSVPEFAGTELYLGVIGNNNTLEMTGVRQQTVKVKGKNIDLLTTASVVDVLIQGNTNDVSIYAGTSIDFDLLGSNYTMDVNYNLNKGVYITNITNVGTGQLTIVTPDGDLNVSRK